MATALKQKIPIAMLASSKIEPLRLTAMPGFTCPLHEIVHATTLKAILIDFGRRYRLPVASRERSRDVRILFGDIFSHRAHDPDTRNSDQTGQNQIFNE